MDLWYRRREGGKNADQAEQTAVEKVIKEGLDIVVFVM
jgi:hypothetical protein